LWHLCCSEVSISPLFRWPNSVNHFTASAGAHAHTVGIGAHTHSVAIGSHGHTITVNAAGNVENTVKNIAFNYIVRLA
ncbi:hypothetical protein P2S09_23390, partial [Escherichia coli]